MQSPDDDLGGTSDWNRIRFGGNGRRDEVDDIIEVAIVVEAGGETWVDGRRIRQRRQRHDAGDQKQAQDTGERHQRCVAPGLRKVKWRAINGTRKIGSPRDTWSRLMSTSWDSARRGRVGIPSRRLPEELIVVARDYREGRPHLREAEDADGGLQRPIPGGIFRSCVILQGAVG